MISCTHGLWLQEIFCKEMESVEKETDLGQDRANHTGTFRDQFCNVCFGYAVTW